jgi:hypothetical protein
MASRYRTRRTANNRTPQYRSIFERRGVSRVRQFLTGRFTYPTADQINTLDLKNHMWKTGDHFYKLAHKYYNDPSYWWVIALFNQKPTEASLNYGDIIKIPLPLERILNYYRI